MVDNLPDFFKMGLSKLGLQKCRNHISPLVGLDVSIHQSMCLFVLMRWWGCQCQQNVGTIVLGNKPASAKQSFLFEATWSNNM